MAAISVRLMPLMHSKSHALWFPPSLPAFLPPKSAERILSVARRALRQRLQRIAYVNQRYAKWIGNEVDDNAQLLTESEMRE